MIGALFVANNVSLGESDTSNYRGGYGGLVASATVDEVATAQVAKHIAQGGNLLIADNISNLADSLEAQVEFSATNDSYLSKPQIVSTDARTREDIINYTAKEGDTVSKLAGQFNVTSDSIRWANDLTGNEISVGTKLKIPPVSGIIYTVEDGDTAKTLAEKYNSNADAIISFNDAELTGLKKGQKIIIPGGEEPNIIVEQAPVYFATAATSSASTATFAFGTTPLYGGNGYSYGYCTWHAANRRADIGRPIPRNLGNANTWASFAASAGLTVSENPTAGAVLWHKNTAIAGGYGHVAFVESIAADGSAVVSDMNYSAGWGAVSTRVVGPEEFSQYLFIL